MKKKLLLFTILSIVITVLVACGDKKEESKEQESATEIRIGYFPNMTHIATIIALEKGYFTEQIGSDIKLTTSTFNDGSAFMEAMSTDSIDLGTVGPTPAINTYVKNPKHEIIAGAVNGGAVLVVGKDSGINSIEDLKGKKVAVPTFGSTQDVGLMKSLQESGLTANSTGSGDITTIKQAPADTAALMLKGEIDAAATQEPWGVNIETNGNAKLLLDASQFAWGSDSTNTVVAATKEFTTTNPELTKKTLKAYVKAVEFINENPEESIQLFLDHVKEITGKDLSEDEVKKAFERLTPTTDVKEEILIEMATISKDAGYISTDNIDGLVNLSFLKDVLSE